MRLLIQRVKNATITIDSTEQFSIGQWAVVYLWISAEAVSQASQKIARAVERLLNIPLFSDHQGRLKRSIQEINGDFLIVSNFTVYGKNKKGNQLDFTDSASFAEAKAIYEEFLDHLTHQYDANKIKTGKFGAYMTVDQQIDGPVNIIIDC